MRKRLLTGVLVIAMAASLSACGDNTEATTAATAAATEAQTEAPTEAVTEATTEAVTEAETEAATEADSGELTKEKYDSMTAEDLLAMANIQDTQALTDDEYYWLLDTYKFVDIDYFGVLSLVGVYVAIVDVHVGEQLCAQTILGQHALEHMQEQRVHARSEVLAQRLLLKYCRRSVALTARITSVGNIGAIGPFLAGEFHLVGIDDDHIVATINVGCIAGFVFAAQNLGDFGAKATQYLVGSINDYPFFLDLLSLHRVGLVT